MTTIDIRQAKTAEEFSAAFKPTLNLVQPLDNKSLLVSGVIMDETRNGDVIHVRADSFVSASASPRSLRYIADSLVSNKHVRRAIFHALFKRYLFFPAKIVVFCALALALAVLFHNLFQNFSHQL